MSPFRLSSAGLAAAAALGIAACGDDDKGDNASSSGSTATSTAEVKVVETEFKLTPANPSIAKPGVVTFAVSNAGGIAHALEVEGPSGEAKTGTIEPGKSATLKVDVGKAGTYEWYCPVGNHKDQGMKGEITVAGGGGQKKEDKETGSYGY